MKYWKLHNLIVETRPLVFLCGPSINENDKKDRRNILRKYFWNYKISLEDDLTNMEITPFALVIDKLFDRDNLEKHMNITLLEEIVAACAYKNYVFVDSMSTMLEVGLFSNGYSANQTIALLPKDYMDYKPTMGYFVTETFKKSRNISIHIYENERYDDSQDKEVKLISFPNNTVPDELKSEIKNDFSKHLSPYLVNIMFTTDIHESEKMYYYLQNQTLHIMIPAKILLYFVNKYSDALVITEVVLEYFKQNVCCKRIDWMKVYYMIKVGKMRLCIHSPFSYDINEVVTNIVFFINAIKEKSESDFYKQKYQNLEYKAIDHVMYNRGIYFYQLMGFDFYLLNKLKNIIRLRKKALTKKTLVIHGKKRNIIMYKGTSEGMELRKIHTNIYNTLNDIVDLSNYSFAYKKNTSIKDCINKHIHSQYFMKLDIKDFFNSISKQKLNKIMKIKFSLDEEQSYEKNICNDCSKYKSDIISEWSGLETILNCCFVNYKLPLGLVTSPILANIYMDNFDRRFVKNYPGLIYTRYSDDILISSEYPLDVCSILNFIDSELKYLKLSINYQKTKTVHLKEKGDHVKFLGINIVKEDEKNYITVGKKRLRSLSKDISNVLRGNYSKLEHDKIVGMVEYIKFINLDDYNYLLKIFKLKTGRDFDYNKFRKNIL